MHSLSKNKKVQINKNLIIRNLIINSSMLKKQWNLTKIYNHKANVIKLKLMIKGKSVKTKIKIVLI